MHGLEWITPSVSVAHPMDDGSVASIEGDVSDTAAALGHDRGAYERFFAPLTRDVDAVIETSLSPLLRVPRHPITAARLATRALLPASRVAARFTTPRAKALIAGLAAHSIMPLDRPATGGVGAALAVAGHRNGWPFVAGGSHELTKAMAKYVDRLGGEIRTGWWVESLDELPPARAVLLDVTPAQLLSIARGRLTTRSKRRYARWQYGPAAFKVDFALNAPIPWRNPQVARAGTVHVGGTFEEIAAGERDIWGGRPASRPFVLLTQPSLFDPSRAPEGLHVAWAYCHVPEHWGGDATEAITSQIERFAPGFRDTIIARQPMTPADYESYNPNNVNGTIAGGSLTMRQLVARPSLSPHPHTTPIDHVYLCSAATAPGAGTHGMCGYHAARTALRRSFDLRG